jgi:hypothetical protein
MKRPFEELRVGKRFTVSGHVVGDICFECECRIVEVGGPDGIALAWCDCALPDDHQEMEVLGMD